MEYREGIANDIYIARTEIGNLDRQLKRTISALQNCEEVETNKPGDSEKSRLLIGHFVLIQAFVNSCNAIRSTLEWLETELDVMSKLARGEYEDNKK